MSVTVLTTQPPVDPSDLSELGLDVYDLGHIIRPDEVVAVGEYYCGHVPRDFMPTALRISCFLPTAGIIDMQFFLGNEGATVLADYYQLSLNGGVDSRLLGQGLFDAGVLAVGLPAGASLRLDVASITGVGYGEAFRGFNAAFLGRWTA